MPTTECTILPENVLQLIEQGNSRSMEIIGFVKRENEGYDKGVTMKIKLHSGQQETILYLDSDGDWYGTVALCV